MGQVGSSTPLRLPERLFWRVDRRNGLRCRKRPFRGHSTLGNVVRHGGVRPTGEIGQVLPVAGRASDRQPGLLEWKSIGEMKTSKNRIVLRVRDWLEVEADLGPMVPVAVIAKLLGVGRRRAYRWVERGSVPVVRVYGQAFLPVRGCLKLCSSGAALKGVEIQSVGQLSSAKPKGDS